MNTMFQISIFINIYIHYINILYNLENMTSMGFCVKFMQINNVYSGYIISKYVIFEQPFEISRGDKKLEEMV